MLVLGQCRSWLQISRAGSRYTSISNRHSKWEKGNQRESLKWKKPNWNPTRWSIYTRLDFRSQEGHRQPCAMPLLCPSEADWCFYLRTLISCWWTVHIGQISIKCRCCIYGAVPVYKNSSLQASASFAMRQRTTIAQSPASFWREEHYSPTHSSTIKKMH